MPLGIAHEFASDPPLDIDLRMGDMIVLATDGFFDWSNPEGSSSDGAAGEGNPGRGALPPRQVIATLYDAVVEFTAGTPQRDDVTAVIIKRTSAATAPGTAR